MLLSFSIIVFVIEKFLFDLLNIECFERWRMAMVNAVTNQLISYFVERTIESNFRQKYNNIDRKKEPNTKKLPAQMHLLERRMKKRHNRPLKWRRNKNRSIESTSPTRERELNVGQDVGSVFVYKT